MPRKPAWVFVRPPVGVDHGLPGQLRNPKVPSVQLFEVERSLEIKRTGLDRALDFPAGSSQREIKQRPGIVFPKKIAVGISVVGKNKTPGKPAGNPGDQLQGVDPGPNTVKYGSPFVGCRPHGVKIKNPYPLMRDWAQLDRLVTDVGVVLPRADGKKQPVVKVDSGGLTQ